MWWWLAWCNTEALVRPDIIVVGSGIGGLSAGALLSTYGYGVTVLESHDRIGGCAHGFSRRTKAGTFHFDSGPSLFSGCSISPSGNPLRQVLDAVGESPEWRTYDSWRMYGDETMSVSSGDSRKFAAELERLDERAGEDWRRLMRVNENLGYLIGAVPSIALRADPGVAVTAWPYASRLDPLRVLGFGLDAGRGIDPSGPFSRLLDAARVPRGSLCYRWCDFLAFALSGLPATETSAAAVSFMLREFFAPGAVMDQPVGGSQAVADALARAITKNGGEVVLRARADEFLLENNRCRGVRVGDEERRAGVAVVSNAHVATTAAMLPPQYREKNSCLDDSAPMTQSFLHLHLGFRAKQDEDDAAWNSTVHHITVRSWDLPVDAPDNLVFISIPSVLDADLAPPGYHVLHAYLPATEPYDRWTNLDRDAYDALKKERGEVLWRAVERVIPDVRDRVEVSMVGTPTTHERFLRRPRGTYGPALAAGQRLFPGHKAPGIQGLYCCGDSTFPGIGVPAVAGSGIAVANAIAPLHRHTSLLDAMRRDNLLL
ncbi:hypothetical protein CTAYLR_000989 [Chrysophaeum taylorii]|uniref:Amine oxidase domain-containing protein n=1 Tax=Chrysophaeum taylorii TaxID=2483200 RepID=A0AAD7XMK9_9STRA|nr:hypothetical protein CTAYLR_000989 [Chrysophaeum taylorii]